MNKNIFKYLIYFVIAVSGAVMSGCSKPDVSDSDFVNGIKDINNPREGKEVSFYGETIIVSFVTSSAWDAEIQTENGESWARITSKKNNDAQGKGSVRIVFDKSKDQAKRVARLYVTVVGCEKALVAEFTQDFNDAQELSRYLNSKMHEALCEGYLWRDDYKKLDEEGKIDMDVIYEDFLYENLVKLGEKNIEDGGKYRPYSSLRGQRYIYSYIQELTSGGSASYSATGMPQTKAVARYDLGIGLTMAIPYDETGRPCLLVGLVYPGSPAEKAGLQRGDLIMSVNGTKLNKSNYLDYQSELYYNPQGTYQLEYGRFDEETGMKLITYKTTATCASYPYNPVLLAMTAYHTNGKDIIGYLVLDSFDQDEYCMEALNAALDDFKKNGITDLILDLRFNPGGSVAVCRYLMSSIAGASHYDDVFAKMEFADGKQEVWTFGSGDKTNPDGLGKGPDLGLNRLYVIASENTGSASEIVINSLKGIDFPVTTIGSTTEGKNVGMVVSQLHYNGRRFEFAPINFRVTNAKDEGDYASGFPPDKMLNNQDASYTDDKDPYFPYGTANWEIAHKGDWAFLWAFSLIVDGKDIEVDPRPSALLNASPRGGFGLKPLENVPMKRTLGQFGNLIYPRDGE